MKVSDVGPTKATSATSKKKKTAGGDFADHLKETAAASETAEAIDTPTVSGVDAIVAMQSAPDATQERSRGLIQQHGEDLLDRLDALRHRLLMGSIPKDELVELAQTVRSRRHQSDDAKLNEIIDEVELRAEVEIAKLTRDV